MVVIKVKCLENLSLVADECLENLQNDIEELIASYIDLKQMCYDILDNMIKKEAGRYRIKKVIKIFGNYTDEIFGEGCFFEYPEWVESIEDIAKHLPLWIDDDSYESVVTGIYFGKRYNEKLKNIDKGYWLYREGANWEIELETTEQLFRYLKACISCMNDKEVIGIANQLRDFAREAGYY